MPDDVPNVETRTSNLPSKPIACAIKRALSIVESLSLQTHTDAQNPNDMKHMTGAHMKTQKKMAQHLIKHSKEK